MPLSRPSPAFTHPQREPYVPAESLHSHQRGYDHHGNCHHNGLVDAHHDRTLCQWQLHLKQRLGRGRSVRVSRLHDSLGDLAETQVGESDDGRDGVDHRKEYPLGTAHSEEDQGGNEVHKGGQDLHGVENRADAPLEADC